MAAQLSWYLNFFSKAFFPFWVVMQPLERVLYSWRSLLRQVWQPLKLSRTLLTPCPFWLVVSSGVLYAASTLRVWEVFLLTEILLLHFLSDSYLLSLSSVPHNSLDTAFFLKTWSDDASQIHPSKLFSNVCSITVNTNFLLTWKALTRFVPLNFSLGKGTGSSLKNVRYQLLKCSPVSRKQIHCVVPFHTGRMPLSLKHTNWP